MNKKTVKVLGITPLGLRLFVENEKYFLNFIDFPWFKNTQVNEVFNVERQGLTGLCWPDLDVDLNVDRIKHPDKYPLKAKH